MTRTLLADHLFDGARWSSPARVDLDAQGVILSITETTHAPGAERLDGFVLAGMPNVHSHAFQRALVGRTERRGAGGEDSFWTWRARMYEEALSLTPERLFVLARRLYRECLAAGYTSVGEFHYVHHDPDGAPYANPAELAAAIVEAAREVGLRLVMLPVLYQRGGFDRPASPEQRRFLSRTLDEYLRLVEATRALRPSGGVGVAPHSLRAVPLDILDELIRAVPAETPIHLHISEQRAEVDQCLAHHGRRPIECLIDRGWLSPSWCLVHATHASAAELDHVAASGAVVGLCPSTEANLGDGIFDTSHFLSVGGTLSIGSDSHATVSVAEELRLTEYAQRLRLERRSVLAVRPDESLAESLHTHAVVGGARALGLGAPGLQVGAPFDAVVLDKTHPRFEELTPADALDAWVFGSAEAAVQETWVGGRRLELTARTRGR